MATIDTRPDVVDIVHYAGDTLTIRVEAPASLTDGMTWLAQVKAARDSDVVDAVFAITPPQSSGGPAFLELAGAITSQLAGTGPVLREMVAGTLAAIQRYSGEWDVQVSDNGMDPIKTLAQGTLVIELDVTRSVA
jgi:hypothetical protein